MQAIQEGNGTEFQRLRPQGSHREGEEPFAQPEPADQRDRLRSRVSIAHPFQPSL